MLNKLSTKDKSCQMTDFANKKNLKDHHTPLVRWSLHKYKYLWGVGGKDRDSSLQERTSYTYTLKLS